MGEPWAALVLAETLSVPRNPRLVRNLLAAHIVIPMITTATKIWHGGTYDRKSTLNR